MFLFLFIWFAMALLGGYIGGRKDQPIGGFFVSLLFGPFGLLAVALSSDKSRRPCDYCKEPMIKGASICPHCRKEAV